MKPVVNSPMHCAIQHQNILYSDHRRSGFFFSFRSVIYSHTSYTVMSDVSIPHPPTLRPLTTRTSLARASRPSLHPSRLLLWVMLRMMPCAWAHTRARVLLLLLLMMGMLLLLMMLVMLLMMSHCGLAMALPCLVRISSERSSISSHHGSRSRKACHTTRHGRHTWITHGRSSGGIGVRIHASRHLLGTRLTSKMRGSAWNNCGAVSTVQR